MSFRVLAAFTTVPPLLVSTSLPLLARAARDDNERFDYASRRLAETMLIAGCGVALGLFLGAGFAMRVIAGPGFGPSVEVLRILAVALLGTFVIGARGYALLSLDRLRAMLVSQRDRARRRGGSRGAVDQRLRGQGSRDRDGRGRVDAGLCYEWSLSRTRPELRLAPTSCCGPRAATLLAGAVAIALDVSPLASAVLGLAIYIAALLALGMIPAEIRQALFHRRRRG